MILQKIRYHKDIINIYLPLDYKEINDINNGNTSLITNPQYDLASNKIYKLFTLVKIIVEYILKSIDLSLNYTTNWLENNIESLFFGDINQTTTDKHFHEIIKIANLWKQSNKIINEIQKLIISTEIVKAGLISGANGWFIILDTDLNNQVNFIYTNFIIFNNKGNEESIINEYLNEMYNLKIHGKILGQCHQFAKSLVKNEEFKFIVWRK